jgi:hypothetical protein
MICMKCKDDGYIGLTLGCYCDCKSGLDRKESDDNKKLIILTVYSEFSQDEFIKTFCSKESLGYRKERCFYMFMNTINECLHISPSTDIWRDVVNYDKLLSYYNMRTMRC